MIGVSPKKIARVDPQQEAPEIIVPRSHERIQNPVFLCTFSRDPNRSHLCRIPTRKSGNPRIIKRERKISIFVCMEP